TDTTRPGPAPDRIWAAAEVVRALAHDLLDGREGVLERLQLAPQEHDGRLDLVHPIRQAAVLSVRIDNRLSDVGTRFHVENLQALWDDLQDEDAAPRSQGLLRPVLLGLQSRHPVMRVAPCPVVGREQLRGLAWGYVGDLILPHLCGEDV